MGWPTPQDYNEAIQNPRICFSDPELKSGTPALTPMGLPKPISGAFASVYRIDCPTRRWAVRCFLREYADQHHRYLAISDHLERSQLNCMVGFDFLREGIRVGSRWFPVLKMEWIEGEPLDAYIAKNLKRPATLQSLSQRWSELTSSLKVYDVAHGDLQHGNVLLCGDELRLIDYDGMYVPALAGLTSHEVGHRNYQHPRRSHRDFGPNLDNFSAWVISRSISALAYNPGLWGRLNAGDECLLFRREDFEEPDSSKTLRVLSGGADRVLEEMAFELRKIFGLRIDQVPAIERPEKVSVQDRRSRPAIARYPAWLSEQIEQGVNLPKPIKAVEEVIKKNLPATHRGEIGLASGRVWTKRDDELIVAATFGLRGYGILFQTHDVIFKFPGRWNNLLFTLDGVEHLFSVYPGFWASQPEVGGEPFEAWMRKRNLLPWKPGEPPRLCVSMLGGNRFKLEW